MKFLRLGEAGHERPAVLGADLVPRDISHLIADITPEIIARGLPVLSPGEIEALPPADGAARVGSCLAWVPNFYCIGLNYLKPEAQRDMRGSQQVVVTSKSSRALAGPFDTVFLPAGSTKTDWEVELGVVIGRKLYRASRDEARAAVAGYCVVNDLCEREYMFEHGGQWIKGKSVPGYGPTGPWLVTPDEIPDPQALSLWLDVNDVRMQEATTADMLTGVFDLVAHMSRYMELGPGDLIATGTPPGIGHHRTPPLYLKPGDRLRLGIGGLGGQSCTVEAMAS